MTDLAGIIALASLNGLFVAGVVPDGDMERGVKSGGIVGQMTGRRLPTPIGEMTLAIF